MSDAPDLTELAGRLSSLEDKVDCLVKPQTDDNADEIAALRAEVERLESELADVRAEQESYMGVDDPEDSNPKKRAEDLRAAMIEVVRSGVNSSSGGVTWWWKEVRDQLASHGHGGYSKPVYHTAMKNAAKNKDAFEMTTKRVTLDNGRTMDVNAIRVRPDELLGQGERNQLTTVPTRGAATDGGEPAADVSTTND